MSMLGIVFESAVAVVLVLVAALCWRLDRRLTALKTGQDGVRRTVVELAEATLRAQESVRGLRAASEEAGRALEDRITRARALADELALLADHGGARSPPPRPSARADEPEPRPAPRGRARRRALLEDEPDGREAAELLDRLRGVR